MRLALLVLIVSTVAAAQQPVDGYFAPYTTPLLPLSAEGQVVSGAGIFGRIEDPIRLLRNPAAVADLADGVRVSGGLAASINGFDDLDAGAGAVSGGLTTTVAGRPVSVGVGLVYGRTAYEATATDEFGRRIGEVQSSDDLTTLGVGVRVAGPLDVRFGTSLSALRSAPFAPLNRPSDPDPSSTRARALSLAVGGDVTAPVGRWIQPEPAGNGLRLAAEASAGLAVRGLTLSSSAPEVGGVPLGTVADAERVLTVGAAVQVGVDATDRGTPLRWVRLDLSADVEAEGGSAGDLLSSFVGDDDGDTVTRLGARVELGEALALGVGRFDGPLYIGRSTAGVTVSAGGALRLVARLTENPGLSTLGDRFDVRYTYARQSFDESFLGDSGLHGLVVRIRP